MNTNTITDKQESTLRQQAAMHRGCLEEINKILIAAGREPEPDSILTDAKVLVYGVKAKVRGGFRGFIDGFKSGINNVQTAGKEELIQTSIDKQVNEQMNKLRKELEADIKKKM